MSKYKYKFFVEDEDLEHHNQDFTCRKKAKEYFEHWFDKGYFDVHVFETPNSGELQNINIVMENKTMMKLRSFTDDLEKMRDFYILSKSEFLESYSYLTEKEYDLTMKEVVNNGR